jgi:hypothetical protein
VFAAGQEEEKFKGQEEKRKEGEKREGVLNEA